MRTYLPIRHFVSSFGMGLLMLVLVGCNQESIVAPEIGDSDQILTTDADAAASKGSHKESFNALQIVTAGSPPEVTVRGKVRHSRDAKASGILSGDIEGTWTSTGNAVLVQKGDVLRGTVHLTATIDVSELFGEPVSGNLEIRGIGHQEISPDGVTHTGRSHGYGTGDLEGIRVKATYALVSSAPPTFTIEGYIRDAH